MSEVKKLIDKLEKQVIKSGQTSQADEERGKVLDSFLKEFEQNRKRSLIDILEKLSGFFFFFFGSTTTSYYFQIKFLQPTYQILNKKTTK